MATVVSGGSAPFTLAAAASAIVERRTVPGEPLDSGLRETRAIIERLGLDAECRELVARDPWELSDTPAARQAPGAAAVRGPRGCAVLDGVGTVGRRGRADRRLRTRRRRAAHRGRWVELDQLRAYTEALTSLIPAFTAGRSGVGSRDMKRHVLILGAGFAGLELATRLSETVPDAVRVTLLDRSDSFHFGYSKLEVMFGRESADAVRIPYREIAKEGVEFRQERVVGIDPVTRRVATDAGVHDADFLVVAMGADYDMAATPGFEAGGHEYYTLAGAERLRDALTGFEGGRVLVAVLGQPFKCPPAPFEGSFLLHEHFTRQGIREAVEMVDDVPDAASRAGDRRGVADVPRRAGRTGHRGAPPAPGHQHRPGGPGRAAQERRDDALRPVHRDPRPPGTRPAHGFGAGRRRLGAGRPDQPQDALPRCLRRRRRQLRPAHRPEGGNLRRVGRAGRGRRHRGGDRRRGTTCAVRGLGHLLRRVRRRARQQGGGQLPGRPVRGRRAQRAFARLRCREGWSSARRAARAGSEAELRDGWRYGPRRRRARRASSTGSRRSAPRSASGRRRRVEGGRGSGRRRAGSARRRGA